MKPTAICRLRGCCIFVILVLGIGACERRQPRTEITRAERVEAGLLPAVLVHGQPGPPAMKLSARMAHYHVPGVSIAVINHGTVEWAKGYGVLDATGTKTITPDTLFQAASISKPVTAVAALALVQAGRLRLDDNVDLQLKSWKVADNEFTRNEKVTLRRLLNHTAGFNVEDVGSYAAGEPLPTLVQALDGVTPAHSDPIRVHAIPGAGFRYSGGGYSVVQQLLIDVTGKPFPDLMQELVLSRVRMASSTFRQPLPPDLEPVAATAHQITGDPFKGRWFTFPQAAAAGLWTTPSDLAHFAIEIQRAYRGQSSVLSTDMANQMLTSQPSGYGLGLWLGGKDQSRSFSHGGKNEGFTCMLFAYLETGQGAVVMTNGDGGNGLLNEILRALAHEYSWPDYQPPEKTAVPATPEAYPAYAGEYDVRGIRTTIRTNGDRLFLLAPPVWPQPVPLYQFGDDRFFLVDEDIDVTFVKDGQGRVISMYVVGGGQTVAANRVK